MSYPLGTKLSYANGSERAVHFAENKVMVTMADGQVMRQVLTLDDWLAFAGDQDIVADTSCVAKLAEQTNKARAMAATTYPVRSIGTYPVRPIGTMLRYAQLQVSFNAPLRLYDTQSAVVTKKGILIVKTRKDGIVCYKKMLFESEALWRSSLPDDMPHDMTVTVTEPQSVVQKRQLQTPLISDMSDTQKLMALKKTYKVGTGCYTGPSNNENLAMVRRGALLYTETIQILKYYEEWVKYWEKKCASQTAEQNDSKQMKTYHSGKNAFYLIVGDNIHAVTTFDSGEFIVDLKTKQLYKRFADIPGCLNAAGKPKLTVFYKNEYISLADKF